MNKAVTASNSKKDVTDDPRTPVVVAQTKVINATEAESATMNSLLQRLEMGQVDLQSQLDILGNDTILCGMKNTKSFALSMPKAD